MALRSPSKSGSMEDVELGNSSHHGNDQNQRHRPIKAKNSDVVELQPLVANGDGSSKGPQSPRSAEAESHSFWKSIVASAMYSGCSVGMVLVNKSLASR